PTYSPRPLHAGLPICSVTSAPPARRLPGVGRRNPAIARPTVVLPEPDSPTRACVDPRGTSKEMPSTATNGSGPPPWWGSPAPARSEEHTSELQSRFDL